MAIYSDLNRFNAKAQPRVEDLDSIDQSIDNIINTPPRQRLFRPEGFDVESLLFELDVDTEWRVKNLIFNVYAEDGRVSLLYGETSVVSDPENNTVHISASFKVKGLDIGVVTRVGTFNV